MTASSSETRDLSKDQATTQWGSEGFNAAVLKVSQRLQQQMAGFEVDQSMMACL